MSAGADMADDDNLPALTPEQQRRRRGRSIAIALALVGLIVAMIAITLVKGPGILVRPL
jgi:hypothetical protein